MSLTLFPEATKSPRIETLERIAGLASVLRALQVKLDEDTAALARRAMSREEWQTRSIDNTRAQGEVLKLLDSELLRLGAVSSAEAAAASGL